MLRFSALCGPNEQKFGELLTCYEVISPNLSTESRETQHVKEKKHKVTNLDLTAGLWVGDEILEILEVFDYTEDICDGFWRFSSSTQRAAKRRFLRPQIDIDHHIILLSIAVFSDVGLLREDPEDEVALLAGLESARDDDIGAGRQSEPLAHLLGHSCMSISLKIEQPIGNLGLTNS